MTLACLLNSVDENCLEDGENSAVLDASKYKYFLSIIPKMMISSDCEPIDLSVKGNRAASNLLRSIFSENVSTTSDEASLATSGDHPAELDYSNASLCIQHDGVESGASASRNHPVTFKCRLGIPTGTLLPRNIEDRPLFNVHSAQITPETRSLIEASNRGFVEYKRKILSQLHRKRKSNPNMARKQAMRPGPLSCDYLEKRRKNNMSAKRSRDLRKRKYEDLQMRYSYLKQDIEVEQMKLESLKMELASLPVANPGNSGNQFPLRTETV